jgi:CubicO group peptidase (beta-lactamase class C family)
VLAAMALAGAISCAGGPGEPHEPELGSDATSYWPSNTWRTTSPSRVGIDEGRLSGLVQKLRAGTVPGVDGLVVVRRGYVAVDETFNGWSRDSIHTMQSVTKSVTSLATGIAIARGDLAGVDQRVLELFPDYANIANVDDRKRAMTVRDLLTMRTGLDWSEQAYAGSPLEALNNSTSDWLRFVLDWPMRELPGTRWEYNSGGVILLGGAIGLAAHVNEADYVREHLFRPIGITGDKWVRGFPDLLPHSGGGLYIRTMDLARIGYLVLRDGRWNDDQVVPAAWMRESTRLWVAHPRTFNQHAVDYGYLWWLLPIDGSGGRERPRDEIIITAAGARGQWLFVLPRYDLVVAVTSNIVSGNEAAPIDFLYTDILPAMH